MEVADLHFGFLRSLRLAMAVDFMLSLASTSPLLLELLLILPSDGTLCHEPLPLLMLPADELRVMYGPLPLPAAP